MADLSRMLEVAKSALYTYRYAMDVTSQNIANAHSEGYTRQRPDVETALSVKTPYGYLGTGVELKKVERVREGFLDQEIRTTNYNLGDANNQTKILDRIQTYLNEPLKGGISTELDNFFKAFQNLAANPEDAGVRQSVIQQGVTLTKEVNYLATGFDNVKTDVLRQVEGRIKNINDLTQEIALLNKQIFSLSPSSVNELEDIRDRRLDSLAKLIDIQATKDNNGLYNISSGGSTLISGVDAFALDIKNSNSSIDVIYKGTDVNITALLGELGADLKAYNVTVPGFFEKLNTFSMTLKEQVNNVHKTGYGLPEKATGVAPTGYDFFVGTDSRSFKINSELLNDSVKLAASKDGKEGNNENALEIAGLLDKQIFDNNTTSMVQYYRALVTEIGFAASDSKRNADALDKRLSNLENLRMSNSGVSLDDEMVNLIKYQRSFDAAAKVVNTVDQMYETILNLKR